MTVRPPRILLCSPHTVTPRLGASKVYIEVAQGLRALGWEVKLIGMDELSPGHPDGEVSSEVAGFYDYLRRHASEFDVVEYEHNRLPFPRSDFPRGPLFVARSVLLSHQLLVARIPPIPTVRGRAGRLLKGWLERARQRRIVRQAERTLRAADLINVANTHDHDLLVQYGHPPGKVLLFPYGLFPERLAQFRPDALELPDPATIAMVGTFDPRKGMAELPRVVSGVLAQHPQARFRLLGAAGLLRCEQDVLRFFPPTDRPHVQVVLTFEPDELPRLLGDCSLGVFPSHCEGFGFGVLEMLAAGLPVLAYDAPGPPMMLPPDLLVPTGDATALARQVSALLRDAGRLREARRWARSRAEQFSWPDIAARTAQAYLDRLGRSHLVRSALTTPQCSERAPS